MTQVELRAKCPHCHKWIDVRGDEIVRHTATIVDSTKIDPPKKAIYWQGMIIYTTKSAVCAGSGLSIDS